MLDTTMPSMPSHITEICSKYTMLMKHIQQAVYRDGISPAQAYMIMALGNETVRSGDLIRLQYYFGTNATYSISKLEEDKYIKRSKVNGDRRQKLVSLTEKGLKLCIRLRRELESMETEVA
jgi:MarR family transcriptional regulator, exopolysaccharide II synthesis transcriptional activator